MWELATLKGEELMIFGVDELLLSNLSVFGFFMVNFRRGAIFGDFSRTFTVLSEVNGPCDIFFCGMGIFDEMPELSDIFGHDWVTVFSGFSFFHY